MSEEKKSKSAKKTAEKVFGGGKAGDHGGAAIPAPTTVVTGTTVEGLVVSGQEGLFAATEIGEENVAAVARSMSSSSSSSQMELSGRSSSGRASGIGATRTPMSTIPTPSSPGPHQMIGARTGGETVAGLLSPGLRGAAAEITGRPLATAFGEEDQLTAAAEAFDFLGERLEDVSIQLFCEPGLRQVTPEKLLMHPYGCNVAEIELGDLVGGHVIMQLVGDDWDGEVSPVAAYRVAGFGPILLENILKTSVVPWALATIRPSGDPEGDTVFVLNHVGLARMQTKGETVRGMKRILDKGVSPATKAFKESTKEGGPGPVTTPFPARHEDTRSYEKMFSQQMVPAMRACHGDREAFEELVMGQTSVTSEPLIAAVLGKLTGDDTFKGLDCLHPKAIKAALLLALDPVLPVGIKIAGLHLCMFVPRFKKEEFRNSMKADVTLEALSKFVLYMAKIFSDKDGTTFQKIVDPLVRQLSDFAPGSLRNYRPEIILELSMKALCAGVAPFFLVKNAKMAKSVFVDACAAACVVDLVKAKAQREDRVFEQVDRGQRKGDYDSKSHGEGSKRTMKAGGGGGSKSSQSSGNESRRSGGKTSHGSGGYDDRREYKGREDDAPPRKRERNEDRPAPVEVPTDVCFAYVKCALGVAGATPCRDGNRCRFEHMTWPKRGISDAARNRLVDCLGRLKGQGAGEAVAAAKALPRA